MLPKQAKKSPFCFCKRNGVFFWLLLRRLLAISRHSAKAVFCARIHMHAYISRSPIFAFPFPFSAIASNAALRLLLHLPNPSYVKHCSQIFLSSSVMASLLASCSSTLAAFLPSSSVSSSSPSSSSSSHHIQKSSVSWLSSRFCNNEKLYCSLKKLRSRGNDVLQHSTSVGIFRYPDDMGYLKREKIITTTCRASSSPSQRAATILEKGGENKTLPPEVFIEEMKAFLRRDLIHLFDEQGIDKSMYDPKVEFRDPITNYDSLEGYLFNIQMLRLLFHPIFELHTVKQVTTLFPPLSSSTPGMMRDFILVAIFCKRLQISARFMHGK